MFFKMILVLAMTLHGELSYNNPDRIEESQLIYQSAKNRSKICNTDISTELLKKYQYSSQNDENCKNGKSKGCLNINKQNVHLYARRLKDVFLILLQPDNKDILFYHAKSMTLKDTGQNAKSMKLVLEKSEHLYYNSTDKSFCNAEKYNHNKKVFKNIKPIVKSVDPLEQYRKKLRQTLNKKKLK